MTVEKNPIAWMRKWAFDGEKPVKTHNKNGRLSWGKFKLLPVTQGKCCTDDIPLYADSSPVNPKQEQDNG